MKTRFLFVSLAASLLSAGCAHRAALIAPPDASRMNKSHAALAAGIVTAKADAKAVSDRIGKAAGSHAVEVAQLAAITPKAQDLLRTAPPEVRPAVEALASDLETLRSDQQTHEADLRGVKEAQDAHGSQLEKLAVQSDQAAKDRAEYEAAANILGEKANASEAGWAKDSAALAWYRLRWWGAWIVAGLGVVACVVVGILKFSGRLAVAAATKAP